MEINQVRFGNFSIGNSNTRSSRQKSDNNESQLPEVGVNNQPQINPEEMFSAMNIAGLHNMSQVNQAKKEVNPLDYLSEERIANIEAMMEGFERGVQSVAEIVGEELPNISEANKNALAASIFAQE